MWCLGSDGLHAASSAKHGATLTNIAKKQSLLITNERPTKWHHTHVNFVFSMQKNMDDMLNI